MKVWEFTGEFFARTLETLTYDSSPVPTVFRPSDRVQKKMENYAEIFGNVMRRKLTILQKRHQIMWKFLK